MMNIVFNTSQGKFYLQGWTLTQTLYDVCRANFIPVNSVSFYVKRNSELKKITGLFEHLKSFETYDELTIQANRNIDYSIINNLSVKSKKVTNSSTEYLFSNADENCIHHIEMNTSDCKRYVASEVDSFIENVEFDNEKKIIFGISGGGDSNTLLEAFLSNKKVKREQVIAVMCLGIPDWDTAVDRAIEICNNSNVELQIADESLISEIIGKDKNRHWTNGFTDAFEEGEIYEVLGTLIIRITLSHFAKQNNAQAIVIGPNLEDLLAECILSLMQGNLPAPFPVRKIGGIPYWYPLYKVPKNILDGCHPKLSLENYNQRTPDYLKGRAIPYILAQFLNTIIPGMEFDLLEGLQKLSSRNENYSHFDNEIGFEVMEPISKELKDKWKYFTTW